MTKLMQKATPEDLKDLGFIEKSDDTADPRGVYYEMRNSGYCIHIDAWFETTLNKDGKYVTIEISDLQDLQDLIEFITPNPVVIPKISITLRDESGWFGWSNRNGTKDLDSLKSAVEKVKSEPNLPYIISDADNLKIWLSDMMYSDFAIKRTKKIFDVIVPVDNIIIGLPSFV